MHDGAGVIELSVWSPRLRDTSFVALSGCIRASAMAALRPRLVILGLGPHDPRPAV